MSPAPSGQRGADDERGASVELYEQQRHGHVSAPTRLPSPAYTSGVAPAVRALRAPQRGVDDPHDQRAAERRPEAADGEAVDDLARQPQHQRVDRQQEQPEREDHGRQREEDDRRAHDEVDDAEDRAGQQQRAEVLAVADRRDHGGRDEQRHAVGQPGDQQADDEVGPSRAILARARAAAPAGVGRRSARGARRPSRARTRGSRARTPAAGRA